MSELLSWELSWAPSWVLSWELTRDEWRCLVGMGSGWNVDEGMGAFWEYCKIGVSLVSFLCLESRVLQLMACEIFVMTMFLSSLQVSCEVGF